MFGKVQWADGFGIIQNKRFVAQPVFVSGYHAGNFVNFSDVLAAVGDKYYRLVGIFDHFNKRVNINIFNFGNILRISHRHGKRNVFQTVHKFRKVSGVCKYTSATLAGFQIKRKSCVGACAVKGIFIYQGHGFVAVLVVKGNLARCGLDSFFGEVGGQSYPVFIKYFSAGAGKHFKAFGMFHLYADLFKNFKGCCVNRQCLLAAENFESWLKCWDRAGFHGISFLN